ncbi:helix-turn-helix domain-containing protein [Hymenobacter baengnokdamensis]|uniref:helix-turn-helix domain-containing protein n=1 Tax=Hymenobacter baengnokdamensis TaxID=2615203 RepID=UPI0012488E68|nr:helix-turn-helix domain-containing protein [Hymenobacter baengnokdamensis]
MHVAVVIPEQEWRALLADVQRLKANEAARAAALPAPPDPNELFTVRQVADLFHMSLDGIRKARRQGRLSGVRLNEKEWGFRRSELERYLKRYNRPQFAQAA